jgi:hypothetical protein
MIFRTTKMDKKGGSLPPRVALQGGQETLPCVSFVSLRGIFHEIFSGVFNRSTRSLIHTRRFLIHSLIHSFLIHIFLIHTLKNSVT